MSNDPLNQGEMAREFARTPRLTADLAKTVANRLLRDRGFGFTPLSSELMLKTLQETTHTALTDPSWAWRLNQNLWSDGNRVWRYGMQRMLGLQAEAPVKPSAEDRRYKDDRWQSWLPFDLLKQYYLSASRHILDAVDETPGQDAKRHQQHNFYTKLFLDSLSPGNFAATNPAVIEEATRTHGLSLVRGFNNFLTDLIRGGGRLRIRMTDLDKFELGENVATTPGKVVFQNELMQLIQYAPTTETVYKRPLLIIPPWINKYYILDLREKNSFIKWAVDQGHTVFVISWVNPDSDLAQKTLEDYMLEGPLAAMQAIETVTGENTVKAIGYCLGGTLLAATLAYLSAKNDNRIRAATFFTTMTDFSDPGELGVFLDEDQIDRLQREMNKHGYLDGAEMATAFNLLRANDLIWSFVVNNYLLGREPFPFDLLYWNSDSTRMPLAMHGEYLRKLYLQNKLVQPGGLKLDGTAIDLTTVKTPSYVLSTREDHIAPWQSTYAATQLFTGPTRFVLGASGHIAGVINPPAANKYGYWRNDDLPQSPQVWLDHAAYHEGSWWPDWQRWGNRYNGGKRIPARVPGTGDLPAIEDAPGSYVKNRIG